MPPSPSVSTDDAPTATTTTGPLRRFEGGSLDAVLEHVHRECGPDATIVKAERVRRGGVGGFFAKELFEVVVDAGDPAPPATASAPTAATSTTTALTNRPVARPTTPLPRRYADALAAAEPDDDEVVAPRSTVLKGGTDAVRPFTAEAPTPVVAKEPAAAPAAPAADDEAATATPADARPVAARRDDALLALVDEADDAEVREAAEFSAVMAEAYGLFGADAERPQLDVDLTGLEAEDAIGGPLTDQPVLPMTSAESAESILRRIAAAVEAEEARDADALRATTEERATPTPTPTIDELRELMRPPAASVPAPPPPPAPPEPTVAVEDADAADAATDELVEAIDPNPADEPVAEAPETKPAALDVIEVLALADRYRDLTAPGPEGRDLVAVVGELDVARRVAASLAARTGAVVAVAGADLPDDVPAWARLGDPGAARARRTRIERGAPATVVAVGTGAGLAAHRSVLAFLDALRADQVRLAVQGLPDEDAVAAAELYTVDALDVVGLTGATDPDALLAAGAPLGTVEGRDADAGLLAALKLAGGGRG